MYSKTHARARNSHLFDDGGIGVAGLLHSSDICEGGLVWRTSEDAEEVLEVVVACWTAHQENACYLDLFHQPHPSSFTSLKRHLCQTVRLGWT